MPDKENFESYFKNICTRTKIPLWATQQIAWKIDGGLWSFCQLFLDNLAFPLSVYIVGNTAVFSRFVCSIYCQITLHPPMYCYSNVFQQCPSPSRANPPVLAWQIPGWRRISWSNARAGPRPGIVREVCVQRIDEIKTKIHVSVFCHVLDQNGNGVKCPGVIPGIGKFPTHGQR